MFLKVCSKLNWLRGFCGRSSIKLLLDGSEDDGSIRCSIRDLSGTRGLNIIPKHKEWITATSTPKPEQSETKGRLLVFWMLARYLKTREPKEEYGNYRGIRP